MGEHPSRNQPARKARVIPFYLPQFHPIPENDSWWGKGFTEWTNVAKAKPLFPEHTQPRLPGSLGFYDLRVPEVRAAQAEMALAHGIEGFCYWHYWFGLGRRLLERPIREVVESGSPAFPFCLAWANESWTGIWHGCPNRMLMEQKYAGRDDYEGHFHSIERMLADSRYITMGGAKIFVVYRPFDLPNTLEFTDCWRQLADQAGIGPLHFIAGQFKKEWISLPPGFDSAIVHEATPLGMVYRMPKEIVNSARNLQHRANHWPQVWPYQDLIKSALPPVDTLGFCNHPCIFPNWDNTPRSGANGFVFEGACPELFVELVVAALRYVETKPADQRLVFVKSWNEWAEGNCLEPDSVHGLGYLQAIAQLIRSYGKVRRIDL
jgi:hypothetical protein